MAAPFGQKSPEKAIFDLANCESSPIIGVFVAFFNEKTIKTHKYNRLPGIRRKY
jgi:hypothetical protein